MRSFLGNPALGAPQLIARWGDLEYLQAPRLNAFAVVVAQRREKAFYDLPHAIRPQALHAHIEDFFGVSAERVEEFVWAV